MAGAIQGVMRRLTASARVFVPVVWLAMAAAQLAGPPATSGADCRSASHVPVQARPEPSGPAGAAEEDWHFLCRRQSPLPRAQALSAPPRRAAAIRPARLAQPSPVSLPADLLGLARTWHFRFRAAQAPRAPSHFA